MAKKGEKLNGQEEKKEEKEEEKVGSRINKKTRILVFNSPILYV